MIRTRDGSEARIGWIEEVQENGRVWLLLQGQRLGPYVVPDEGFAQDAFGVGAKVRRTGDRPALLGEVQRRDGPFALVEDPGGERRWSPVLQLTLVGAGSATDLQEEKEILLAPWHENDSLYPAAVLQDVPGEPQVRVGYLDDDNAWVERDRLRPLPVQGEQLTYTDAAREDVKAIVAGYPSRWLVEVVRKDDRRRVLVGLHQVKVRKGDRE